MEENNTPQQPQEAQSNETAQPVNPPTPPQQPTTPAPNNNGSGQVLGIIGFVLGIISIILAFIPCIGLYAIFPGAIALILAIIGLMQVNKSGGSKGLSIAGIIISAIAIIIAGIQYYYLSSAADKLKDAAIDMGQFSDDMTDDMGNDSDKAANDDVNTALQKMIDEKDYDKVIEMYDKSVGEYIEAYEGLQKGHISASMKMMTAGAKISIIAMKIATISAFLSEEQEQRFEEINNKYDKILKEKEASESDE